MATDTADQQSEHAEPDVELAPDSTRLRVSRHTLHESGIPPARHHLDQSLAMESDEHVQLALVELTRTEANLGLLLRGLAHLTAGANAAREANNSLMQELESLRAVLSLRTQEEAALQQRVKLLETALERTRHEAAEERQYLFEQQDLFIAELLGDHEREILELSRKSAEALARTETTGEEIAELIAQRDQARDYARRCERERDLAWQELAEQPPRPTERAAPEARTAIGSVKLRAVHVPASTHGAAAEGSVAVEAPSPIEAPSVVGANDSDVGTEFVPHTRPDSPEALAEAPTPTGPMPVAEAVEPDLPAPPPERPSHPHLVRPALNSKAELASRPLVGYSLSSEDLPEEQLEGWRLGTKSRDSST